jgi:hypothetical protein
VNFTYQHTLKMGTDSLPETSEKLNILTQLSARETFVKGLTDVYSEPNLVAELVLPPVIKREKDGTSESPHNDAAPSIL